MKEKVIRSTFLILWSFCLPLVAWAQLDPPEVECIVTNPDGTLTLTWTAPADPLGVFTEYNLFEIDPGDLTATFITTIGNYNTTSITIPGYDGNIDAQCFYMETVSNGGLQVSDPSATLCNIYLQVNPGLQPGTVDLAWNFPYPLIDPATLNGAFTLFVEYDNNWSEHFTVPALIGNNIYTYEVDICTALLNFQVRYSDGSLCDTFSNVDGDIFEDQINPDPPQITAVSVDSLTGQAIVQWSPPPQNDVNGYILYECFPGLNPMPIDTIFDANITTWQNPNSDADLGPEAYNIAAFDSCLTTAGNPDPGPGNLACSQSIYLTHVWQTCSDQVNLGWTPAEFWDGGVAFYEIYAQEEPIPGSGIYENSFVLDVVPGDQFTFVHENATLGSSYRYRVKAYSNDLQYDASSNVRVATLAYPNSPQFTYITNATVNAPELVVITAQLDPSVGTAHTYYLEKLRPNEVDWEDIASQTVLATAQIVFQDEDVDTNERSYSYRIRVENNCGDIVGLSNIGKTIHVSGLANTSQIKNTIIWNEYEEWEEGVQTYQIFRRLDDEPFPTLLDEVPGSVLFYEDDVRDLVFTEAEGEFCYTIIAVEEPNLITIPSASVSNEFCLTQEPVIWVPNAFVVDGFNNIFKPVISFADFDNYQMEIYSRWGDLIFRTTDINVGWDGVFKTELVPEGVYAYYISIADGAGKLIERRGKLTMLKSAID